MTTVRDARRTTTARLAVAGVESAALDARMLIEAASGLDAAAQAGDPDRVLDPAELDRLASLTARRVAREPMSQILGRVGFWTIELAVTPDVLTPRPETETVLEAALAVTAGRQTGRVIDFGVGAGPLLLGFLHERPGWFGVGVDASRAALEVARANARALTLSDRAGFAQGDWDEPIASEAFDLVLANPPYIASGEIAGLAPEVRDHEPRLALDGGADGLDAYRRLAPAVARVLSADGAAALEIGARQGDSVAALIASALPRAQVRVLADLAGLDRAVVVTAGAPGL